MAWPLKSLLRAKKGVPSAEFLVPSAELAYGSKRTSLGFG